MKATKKQGVVLLEAQGPTLPRLGFDAEEAAAILGIGKTLFYEDLLKNKKILGVYIGGRRVFYLGELKAYLSAETAKACKVAVDFAMPA